MDFDSPDVMKDFPGLYASELNKKCNNDSDYSDETDKGNKKDMLIGKRKDKKDKKDKEKGYAALEGESSADEECKSRSPSKTKKSKSFKFTTKSKDKREKSREKEKDTGDKKKERDKKNDKKTEKEKNKKVKNYEDALDIAEALPIFGVNLETAVERSRCHDGIDIPLPIRECIDYIESAGTSFEGIYKISGTKSKVLLIRKMYNNRQNINLNDYDVPTATSLLKMFLRDLPEPIFTSDSLVRFEEAGAILNLNTREKHLKILVDNLPPLNKLLLSWLIIHLDNISLNQTHNKMTKQNISAALNHTFHSSSRLLHALLHHCRALFPDLTITKYIPPLSSGQTLPDDLETMEIELKKQESLLTQIHTEMNVGCISKEREELLWEVQRIITQLKRKIKTAHKEKEPIVPQEKEEPEPVEVSVEEPIKEPEPIVEPENRPTEPEPTLENTIEHLEEIPQDDDNDKPMILTDSSLLLLKFKNNGLLALKERLERNILEEQKEILSLKNQLLPEKPSVVPSNEGLDELMSLLQKENQILQINKINLVRKIIEQQEICIELKAKLELSNQV
ncbi:unnamed protein product [Brassicogethes aeneus]|uniref:Rho-GAP domain-containing protein n=1 Tax=Brassicogethes aeneus TaxID=1431903 RepID=A0A9P0BBA3_BRAAE|nr:unnamed protein product [Brassicogethes aeneus]